MKATVKVRDIRLDMVRVSTRTMDKLLSEKSTKLLFGVPVYYDDQERIWPHVHPTFEDIRIEFKK